VADFDPDKFLAETAPSGERDAFDPDKFLVETASTAPHEPTVLETGSKTDSGLRGLASGITFGHADEAYGLVGGLVNSIKDDKKFADAYREARDYARHRDAAAHEANPKTFVGGEVAGNIATTLAPGVGVLNAGKGAGVVSTVGKAAAGGALSGLGASEADLTKGEIPEAAADTAMGAALGAGTGAAFHGLSKVAGYLSPDVLKELAATKAFKAAAGNRARAWDEAGDRVVDRGRELLDSGVVTFGASPREIAERAGIQAKKAGSDIGEMLGKLDTEAGGKAGVDGKAIAAKIRAFADKIDSPETEAAVAKLRGQADRYEAMGIMPLKEAQRLKNTYRYNWNDSSIGQESTNTLKGIVGDELEQGVGRAAGVRMAEAPAAADQFAEVLNTSGGRPVARPGSAVLREAQAVPESALSPEEQVKVYKALKSKYGTMTAAAGDAEIAANRLDKNQTIGLKDVATAAAFPGHATTKAAVAVGSSFLRNRGNSMAAVGLDKIGDVLAKTPEAFGRFAAPLQAAATRGGNALAVTHYMLMQQEPEYQKLLNNQD
jgi:hypothetical protein